MTRLVVRTIIAAGVTVLLLTLVTGANAQTSAPLNDTQGKTVSAATSPVERLRTDLQAFSRWLATGSTGAAWRTYLEIDRLESELTHADAADPLVLAKILSHFAEGSPESERPPYLDVRRDIGRWLDHFPPPPQDQLAAMAVAAKAAFVPRSKADVEEARKKLSAAIERLDDRLKHSGSDGERCRHDLLTDEIKEQLAQPVGPSMKLVAKAYARFSSGKNDRFLRKAPGTTPQLVYDRFSDGQRNGLDLVWFKDVKDSLREYFQTVNAVNNPTVGKDYQDDIEKLAKNRQAYRQNPTLEVAEEIEDALCYLEENGQAGSLVSAIRLEELAKHLQAYRKNPTPEVAQAIETALRYLERNGQAGWLVSAIRYHYVNPNVFVQVSKPVVDAGIARDVDNVTAVSDCILGTSISGTAHTIGRIETELIPNNDLAHIGLVFTGQAQANSVGCNGPVEIFSSSCAAFTARKPMFVDDQRVSSAGATASATTNTVVRDIEARRALAERVAWKRVGESKATSDQIAAQHASQRVAASLEDQATKSITRADNRYQKKLREPLLERRIFPSDLHYKTIPSDLLITAIEADQAQLAAPTSPPQVPADDLLVRFHESAVNNLFEGAEAGMTLHQDEFDDDVAQYRGPPLPKPKPDDDKRPPPEWGITFEQHPVRVRFFDNQFSILVRAKSFFRNKGSWEKDREKFDGGNVSALYHIEPGPKGLHAVRQGGLKITDPNGDQLGNVEKGMLSFRFEKIFPDPMEPGVLKLPVAWDAAGKVVLIQKMDLRQWGTSAGWMVAAWHRNGKPMPPEPPAPAGTAAPAAASSPTPAASR